MGHLGDAEVAGTDLDAVYDPVDLIVAELLEAKAVEAVNGAVGTVSQSFGRGGDVPVGGNGRNDVAGVGVCTRISKTFVRRVSLMVNFRPRTAKSCWWTTGTVFA